MTLDHDTDFDLLAPLDDHAGPARRITSARAAAIVDAALDAAARPPATAATAAPRGTWLRTAMAAAVIALFATTASASVYLIVTTASPESKATAPEERPSIIVDDIAPPAEPEDIPAVIVDDIDPPAAPAPRAPRVRSAPETPDDLLRLANERRRDKQWRAADAIYRKVIARDRGSDAAYVATLASASIHLDHLGDARGALRLYRRALRTDRGGALAEEARWGIAEAQRALGDAAAEVAALRELIDRHPRSPLVDRARARLRALEAAAPR